MTKPVTIKCPACGQFNRVGIDVVSAKCGKCKRPFRIAEIVSQFDTKSLFEQIFG